MSDTLSISVFTFAEAPPPEDWNVVCINLMFIFISTALGCLGIAYTLSIHEAFYAYIDVVRCMRAIYNQYATMTDVILAALSSWQLVYTTFPSNCRRSQNSQSANYLWRPVWWRGLPILWTERGLASVLSPIILLLASYLTQAYRSCCICGNGYGSHKTIICIHLLPTSFLVTYSERAGLLLLSIPRGILHTPHLLPTNNPLMAVRYMPKISNPNNPPYSDSSQGPMSETIVACSETQKAGLLLLSIPRGILHSIIPLYQSLTCSPAVAH